MDLVGSIVHQPNGVSTVPSSVGDVAGQQITETAKTAGKERASWGNDVEFLMSCIAMSVGLGNIWRFPFTALENGGGKLLVSDFFRFFLSQNEDFFQNIFTISIVGAFLIPYIIVLLIIGRPLYYMEMLLGQFSSRSSIKVFDLAPALRGKLNLSDHCSCIFSKISKRTTKLIKTPRLRTKFIVSHQL